MAFYLPKPNAWTLDPAATERPDWWKRATVIPYWEGQGLPKYYVKRNPTDGNTLSVAAGVLNTDFGWVKTGTGPAFSFLTTVPRLFFSADSELFNTSFLNRCTILQVTTPNDTTNRNSASFGTRYAGVTTRLAVANTPFSDGNVYFDFGGNSTGTTEISFSGYTKDTTRMDVFAFRAGTAFGKAIFWNGTKKATTATVTTRTQAANDTFIVSGNYNLDAQVSDLIRYHFFAAIDEEWPDAQIFEWMRDPFIMLRPQVRLGRIAATFHDITTNISAAATAVGSAAVTVDRAQLLYPDSDVSAGAWTTEAGGTTNLYASIDETPDASDSDYIQSDSSPASSSAVTIGLSDPAHTIGTGAGRVSVRYYKKGSGNVNLTVRLMDGSTEVASWTYTNISESVVRVNETLSAAQVASITSGGTNLRLKFEAVEA